ncbi:hypothetical protein FRC11_006404, partial [Ceratobasidium sp. 423]
QMLMDIITDVTNSIKDSTTKAKRPKLPQGTQCTPWRPEGLLYTREGHEGVTDMPWPFHQWGSDNPWGILSPRTETHKPTEQQSVVYAATGSTVVDPTYEEGNQTPAEATTTALVNVQQERAGSKAPLQERSAPEVRPSEATSSGATRDETPPSSSTTTRADPNIRAPLSDDVQYSSTLQLDQPGSPQSGDGVFDHLQERQKSEKIILNPYIMDAPEEMTGIEVSKRPATDKSIPKGLPEMHKALPSRRAHSVDPNANRAPTELQRGNALGLDSATGSAAYQTSSATHPGDLTSNFTPDESSTPHARSRSLTRTTQSSGVISRAPGNKTSTANVRSSSVSVASGSRTAVFDVKHGLARPVISLAIGKGHSKSSASTSVPKQSSPLASPPVNSSTNLPTPRQSSAPLPVGDETISGSNLAFAANQYNSRRSATPSSSRERGLASAAPQRVTRSSSTAQKRAHDSATDQAVGSSEPKRARSGGRTPTDYTGM